MDLELDTASRRFARDAGSRRREEALKRETLRREREASRAAKAKRELEKAQAEVEALAQREEEARMRDEDLERNHGVVFMGRLRPYVSLKAETKGIVRRADKISLPRSAQASLAAGSKNGQLFFELSCNGRTTHGSILDFGSDEGTVGVPPQLLRCLRLVEPIPASAQVGVRYRVLPKGEFARVQPFLSEFATCVEDVKGLLERELLLRTTLSAGDEIELREGERAHLLRVLDVQPSGAASLIDTDLECEVTHTHTSLTPPLHRH